MRARSEGAHSGAPGVRLRRAAHPSLVQQAWGAPWQAGTFSELRRLYLSDESTDKIKLILKEREQGIRTYHASRDAFRLVLLRPSRKSDERSDSRTSMANNSRRNIAGAGSPHPSNSPDPPSRKQGGKRSEDGARMSPTLENHNEPVAAAPSAI